MIIVAAWALKYPGSVEEYNERKAKGEKIGWFR
jgi:hypothetical protein